MNGWQRGAIIAAMLGGILMSNASAPVAAQKAKAAQKPPMSDWQRRLQQRLPVYGHRNWIVIADSAYPAQSRPGIETIATGGDQLEIVRAVLAAIGQAPHVRPTIYLDAELPHVDERYAAGIGTYRDQLKKLLGERTTQALPHEQIIAKLDAAGATFNVLILKTTLTLPYTSVFLELDCGYWSGEAEEKLRETMRQHARNP